MAVAPHPPTRDLRAPLWLAHHQPWQLDRCARVGHTAVCRRCLVLYPCVILWWALWAWVGPPTAVLVALSWVLPLPMLLDWVLEHLRRIDPAPGRLITATAVAAPGLASMLALHTQALLEPRAVLPAAAYGTIALVAAWWGARVGRGDDDWRRHHLAEEARRSRRLRSLLDIEGLDGDNGVDTATMRRNAGDTVQSPD